MKKLLILAGLASLGGLSTSTSYGWCFYVKNSSAYPTDVALNKNNEDRSIEAYIRTTICNNLWSGALQPGQEHKDDCTHGQCNGAGVPKISVRARNRTFTIPVKHGGGGRNRHDLELNIKGYTEDHGRMALHYTLKGCDINNGQDAKQVED